MFVGCSTLAGRFALPCTTRSAPSRRSTEATTTTSGTATGPIAAVGLPITFVNPEKPDRSSAAGSSIELLQRAGFERATICASNETMTGDERLVGPDPPGRQCVFVEARVPMSAAAGGGPAVPAGTHLMWTDDGIVVVWSARPAAHGIVRFREVGATAWTVVEAVGEATIEGLLGPAVFRALLADLRPACSYEYVIEQHDDQGLARSAPTAFVSLPASRRRARAGLPGRHRTRRPARRSRRRNANDASTRSLRLIPRRHVAATTPTGRATAGAAPAEKRYRLVRPDERVAESHPLMVQFGNHEVALGERYRDWAAPRRQLG